MIIYLAARFTVMFRPERELFLKFSMWNRLLSYYFLKEEESNQLLDLIRDIEKEKK